MNIRKITRMLTCILMAFALQLTLIPAGTIHAKEKAQSIVSLDKQMYTYKQLKRDLKELKERYPDYIEINSIGKSEEDRDIYEVVIGNPEAEQQIVSVSELHAREYVTSIISMRIIEYYLENYNNKIDGKIPSRVFNNTCLRIIPMANPDGIEIVRDENKRWKANAKGINLNRNFPVQFVSKGSKKDGTYSGKEALCAKESAAIAKWVKDLSQEYYLASINYHSTGSVIYKSPNSQDRDVNRVTKELYEVAKKTTGYSDIYEKTDEKSEGSFRDYCMKKLYTPSITIEVGRSTAPVSKSEYQGIFEKNKYIYLRIAKLDFFC